MGPGRLTGMNVALTNQGKRRMQALQWGPVD